MEKDQLEKWVKFTFSEHPKILDFCVDAIEKGKNNEIEQIIGIITDLSLKNSTLEETLLSQQSYSNIFTAVASGKPEILSKALESAISNIHEIENHQLAEDLWQKTFTVASLASAKDKSLKPYVEKLSQIAVERHMNLIHV